MSATVRSRIAAILTVLTVSVGVGGCSGFVLLPAPPAPTLADADQPAAIEAYLDGRWKGIVAMYPGAVRPDVDLVRIIEPNEWARMQESCVRDQGFDVTANNQGGISISEIPIEQQESLAIAQFACEAMYPVDLSWDLPLTDDELSYLYDYFTKVLTPCLESHGIDVPEPSSRTTFVDSYVAGDAWNPYVNVMGTRGVQWGDINKKCPQAPPGFRE